MRIQKVTIYIHKYILEGNIHGLEEGVRVTDYFNSTRDQFIPVTDVTFMDSEGNKMKEEEYICINKGEVVIVEEKQE